jgi:hypothetical protein
LPKVPEKKWFYNLHPDNVYVHGARCHFAGKIARMLLLVGEDGAYQNIRHASALHLDAIERIAHTPNFPGNYK